MEAATPPKAKAAAKGSDTDFALRLGALFAHVMGSYGGAGAVVRALDGTGLTFIQMKALITVGACATDEQSSVKFIAESLDISLPSASRAVEGLVKKDLATRIEDPEDRRVKRISLNDAGQELVDELVASRLEGLEAFVAELSPAERSKLDAALEVLLQRDELQEIYRSHGRRVAK
jgi:DNA-binding MarR family transcriptional regulator